MWRPLLLAIGIGAIAGGCSTTAPTRSAPQRSYPSLAPAAAASVGVSITLSGDQITSVRAYYASAPSGNGRGRHGRLPPGIAKNLARGKPLPPGLAKSYLPARVVADLPRLPSGLDYVIVAGKLVLVEAATQVIRDVLLDLAFDS